MTHLRLVDQVLNVSTITIMDTHFREYALAKDGGRIVPALAFSYLTNRNKTYILY